MSWTAVMQGRSRFQRCYKAHKREMLMPALSNINTLAFLAHVLRLRAQLQFLFSHCHSDPLSPAANLTLDPRCIARAHFACDLPFGQGLPASLLQPWRT